MTMPDTLTLEQAEQLTKSISSENFDNPHGIDINKVFADLQNESEDEMFHVSKKIIEIDVVKDGEPDKVKFLDVGVTYRRESPKKLSKKARHRLEVKNKQK